MSERREAVHDTRKRIKKLRALLRLVRSEIGSKAYGSENAWLRDTGRLLSDARDAEVVVETFDGFLAATKPRLPQATVAAMRAELLERRRVSRAAVTRTLLDDVSARLHETRSRVDDWRVPGKAGPPLIKGLRRGHAAGRRALAAALEDPSAEALHEWRKRTKDVWYQLRLIQGAWSGHLSSRVDRAHHLSTLLGDDHDLVVLQRVVAELSGFASLRDSSPWSAALAERRQALLSDAIPLGQRLFAEKGKRYARRMAAYWEVWRAKGTESTVELAVAEHS